ncbi:MAG: sigma-54 interaction domain-containing protein [Desulfopila sp.]
MRDRRLLEVLTELLNCRNVDLFSFYENLHEGVIITDTTGSILYYNATQAQIDDIDRDYALGRKVTDLYQLSEETSTTMQCIVEEKPVRNRVIIYRTKLGKIANTISNVFPLFNDSGVVGAISFTKDYQMLEDIVAQEVPSRQSPRPTSGCRFSFADIIGSDHSLVESVNMAKLASGSPSPIMLAGETGTGKELFAQSIHNHGAQARGKFIPVNCAAIPENLLEGILFGTTRGVFTGSIDKPGLFEQADGGTLFLDELDSMPLGLQAKLLRVVQERKVRRLGSARERELNLKIVSTVSQAPMDIIKRARMRQDLFYRMGVVVIMIPPLRQRKADLSPLLNRFIANCNSILNEKVSGVSPEVMDLFMDYDWPGNVRELEHVIEGAMNLVDGADQIGIEHLPPHVRFFMNRPLTEPEKSTPTPADSLSSYFCRNNMNLVENQSVNEIEIMVNALKRTKGNASKAARLLGISPQSFHYKLKKYGLDRTQFM